MNLRSIGLAAAVAAGLSSTPAQTATARPAAELCLGVSSQSVEDILNQSPEGLEVRDLCEQFTARNPLYAQQVERHGSNVIGSKPVRLEANVPARLAGAPERPAQVARQLAEMGVEASAMDIERLRGLVAAVGKMSKEDLRDLEAYSLSGIVPTLAMQELTERSEKGMMMRDLLLLVLAAIYGIPRASKKFAPKTHDRIASRWHAFDEYMKARRKRIDAERERRKG
jgi:hypothetical protein